MPRNKEQMADLIRHVCDAYREIFKEDLSQSALFCFAKQMHEEAQVRFLRQRLGHLLSDDIVLLCNVLTQPPPQAVPPPNVVEMKKHGRPKGA